MKDEYRKPAGQKKTSRGSDVYLDAEQNASSTAIEASSEGQDVIRSAFIARFSQEFVHEHAPTEGGDLVRGIYAARSAATAEPWLVRTNKPRRR